MRRGCVRLKDLPSVAMVWWNRETPDRSVRKTASRLLEHVVCRSRENVVEPFVIFPISILGKVPVSVYIAL